MGKLTKAIKLAVHWHSRQIDKNGEPYIFHPLRVMESVWQETKSESHAVIAVLHDILEDTFCPIKEVSKLCPDILVHVETLTRKCSELEIARVDERGAKVWGKPMETYKEYIERCKGDSVAALVKLYDITDNLSPKRYHEDAPYGRYIWAYEFLTGKDVPMEIRESIFRE